MSISVVGTDTTTTGNGNLTVTYPTGIQAGHLILLWVSAESNPAPTITTPAGFTLVDSNQVGSTNIILSALYAKIASGSESGTFTVTITNGTRNGAYCGALSSSVGFTSVALNVSTVVKDSSAAGGTVNTTTALTNVPSKAQRDTRLYALFAAYVGSGAGTSTQTLTGTNWTELQNFASVGSGSGQKLEVAVNTTDTGTAHTATDTYSISFIDFDDLSFWVQENYLLVGGGATWTWTGAAGTLLFKHLIVGTGGVWSWSGSTAGLLVTRLLVGAGSVWSWAGSAAALCAQRLLVGTGASWSWAGAAAVFVKGFFLERLRAAGNSIVEYLRSPTGSRIEKLRSPDNTQQEKM